MAGLKRTDNKGRILKDGESQRKDGSTDIVTLMLTASVMTCIVSGSFPPTAFLRAVKMTLV